MLMNQRRGAKKDRRLILQRMKKNCQRQKIVKSAERRTLMKTILAG